MTKSLELHTKKYKDGEPCDHPGCLHHLSHPCEACGRIAGRESVQLNTHVSKPTVDRTYEFAEPDNEIVVTLEDGYTERFWLKGLTDEEYIKRARYLRENA